MLILTRKLNEAIQIGESIKVVVCQIDRYSVRIGIQAPREIRIDRVDNRKSSRSPIEEAAISKIV